MVACGAEPSRERASLGKQLDGKKTVRLRFLGTDSDQGSCPAMYATDRGTYVVQGKVVVDAAALGDVRDLADDESIVEIEPALVRHLIEHYKGRHAKG